MDESSLPHGIETPTRLLRLSGEAFSAINPVGLLLWTNSNWKQVVGNMAPEAGTAAAIEKLIHPQDVDSFQKTLAHVDLNQTQPEPILWNGRIMGVNGEYFSASCRIGALEENVLGIFLKHETSAPKNSGENTKNLIQTKTDKLTQSRFVAGMSYQLRTPLNDILGLCELLEKSKLDTAQASMLRDMKESGSTLLAIFDDLSDWARLQTGEMDFLISPTCPETIVTAVKNNLAPAWRARDIQVQITSPATPLYVAADSERLRKVIRHLLNKSIHLTPHKGSISISLSSSASEASIQITDSGQGMNAIEISHLFDGSQHDGAAGAPNLDGLGLSISHAMIGAMQGRISVQNEPGKGTTFTVTLPSVSSEASHNHTDEIRTQATAGTHSLKVLVAEDNPINARVAEGMLKALGHSVVIAQNGLEVEAANWRLFDVILMDVHMPIEDGLEATRKIRKIELSEGLTPMPIYGITASVMSLDRDLCLEAGMDGILEKPVTLEKLRAKLTDNKKNTPTAEPEVISRVRKSYGRCVAKPSFLDSFYKTFLRSSPEIEKMFRKTDLEKQKELIKHGLAILFMFARNPDAVLAREKLTHIGMIHSRNKFNVKPHLYPFWVNSLVDTVAAYDNQFTPKLGEEWRIVLKPAIDYLISLY